MTFSPLQLLHSVDVLIFEPKTFLVIDVLSFSVSRRWVRNSEQSCCLPASSQGGLASLADIDGCDKERLKARQNIKTELERVRSGEEH